MNNSTNKAPISLPKGSGRYGRQNEKTAEVGVALAQTELPASVRVMAPVAQLPVAVDYGQRQTGKTARSNWIKGAKAELEKCWDCT